MNRRGFLKALAGGAVAVALPKLPLDFVPQLVRDPGLSLSEIITVTLRKHAPEIAANVTANNALLMRLLKKNASGVVPLYSEDALEVAVGHRVI